jgi:hypothetical protein
LKQRVVPFVSPVERAWIKYLKARSRAEQSGRLEDGIKMGRALGAFCGLFLTPDQKKETKLDNR